MTESKSILIESSRFAKEDRARSWRVAISSIAFLILSITGGILAPYVWLQIVFSLCAAALISRTFVIYHDYVHGAILRNSKPARAMFFCYGIFSLAPMNVWKRTHDYHHRNNGRIFKPSIGTYSIFTRKRYNESSRVQKFIYLFSRHPMMMLFGYVFTFLYGMCLQPAISDIRKHYDSLLSLIFHAGYIAVIYSQFSWITLVMVVLLPNLLAYALGAYLFYAQHNFPEVKYTCDDEWTYEASALESSSYIKMSKIMEYVTGNIGYHHIHHINPNIPFYRLPEAMNNIPGLQSPLVTTLGFKDVIKCLKLKIWDEKKNMMTPL